EIQGDVPDAVCCGAGCVLTNGPEHIAGRDLGFTGDAVVRAVVPLQQLATFKIEGPAFDFPQFDVQIPGHHGTLDGLVHVFNEHQELHHVRRDQTKLRIRIDLSGPTRSFVALRQTYVALCAHGDSRRI